MSPIRDDHDQVLSFFAPIPIFQKNKFPDSITDEIFDKYSGQIPNIDPIKINAPYKKNPAFLNYREHYGSKKPFRTHETIFQNTEFYVFPTQHMAQIDRKFECKLKRFDPINDQIKKIISLRSSLIDL